MKIIWFRRHWLPYVRIMSHLFFHILLLYQFYQNLAQHLRNLSRSLKSTRSIDRKECFRAEAYLDASALMKKSIPSTASGLWIPRQTWPCPYIFKTMPIIETGHRFCIDKNLIPLQTLRWMPHSMATVNSKQFTCNDKFDLELDKYD